LDLSGADPREAWAEALIAAYENRGPVFVYSSFEASRIRGLQKKFPRLKRPQSARLKRLLDLRPIAEQCYYHPRQKGSWSPQEGAAGADEFRLRDSRWHKQWWHGHGGMAMEAYVEAISPGTSVERKKLIEAELRAYCALDTKAMIHI
jgi:hypothetical protein